MIQFGFGFEQKMLVVQKHCDIKNQNKVWAEEKI